VRRDVGFFQALKGTKGELLLGKDSVKFVARKYQAKKLNFAVSYAEVKKIKRYRMMLIPNRIGIKTKTSKTYRIFTFRRRQILAILESKVLNRK
jgi:hypothetical protein